MQTGDNPEPEIITWLMRIPDAESQAVAKRWEQLLDEDEKQRRSRLRSNAARLRYTLGHGLLRTALTECHPDMTPERWRFRISDKGRPEIDGCGAFAAQSFSLSYSDDLIACAIAGAGRVGIDIEAVSTRFPYEEVIPRTFSARERREMDELPADARRARFFEIWTLKESYLKALGVGLEPELDSFEFSLRQGNRLTTSIPEESSWSFSLYRPDAFHRLALAYNATAPTVVVFRNQVDHDTSEPANCVLLAQSAPRG